MGIRLSRLALASLVPMAVVGCHHAGSAPSPSSPVVATNPDSVRTARARADSIARADARRRDAIAAANARRDSLNRAAERVHAADAARVTLRAPLYFAFNQSDIEDGGRSLLDRKAAIMGANPSLRVRIEGNADERGSDEYNLALGMRRAAGLRRYLHARGIDSLRITIISNGEERPTCTEAAESCWARNRRAEFTITAGGDVLIVGR